LYLELGYIDFNPLDQDFVDLLFGIDWYGNDCIITDEIREKWMFFIGLIALKFLHLKIKSKINKELIESMVQKCTKLQEISIFGLNDYVFKKINENIRSIEVIKRSLDEDFSEDLVKHLAVGDEQQISRLSL
jgi:hypothetical protein